MSEQWPGQVVSAGAEQFPGMETDVSQLQRDPETGAMVVDINGGQPEDVPEQSTMQQIGEGLGKGARNTLHGVAAFADLLGLPAAAVMRMLGADIQPLTQGADQLSDALGLPKLNDGGDQVARAIYDGAITGLGTAGVAAPLAALPGTTGAVSGALAATPVADTVAGATGAAAGEVTRQAGGGPLAQLGASLVGGGLGAAGAMGIPAAARRVTQSTEPSELLAAFGRQQVDPMADQVGGTGARMASGVTRMTLGGIPLAEAAERSIATAKAARDRLANAMGRVADDTGAGQAAQRGAKAFLGDDRKVGALYDAIPVNAKRNTALTNTRQALSELTAGLDSNPELSAMVAENPRLKGFLDALTPKDVLVDQTLPGGGKAQPFLAQRGGELSWEDLKRFRSIIGEIAGQPTLAQDTSQQSIRKLYAALSEDMRATAAQEGPDALRKFERANTYFRARQARIDDTLSAILGDDLKKSPEDAFKQIERWSRDGGDSAAIARMMRSLPDGQASTVRATLFSKMGNAPAARQGVSEVVFSPSDYVTQWNKIDHRAKSVLFPGAEYRQDLDDIARIAEAMKRSSEFANTSRTALAGNGIGLVTMALAGSPVSAGGIAATQFGLGKLLASPRFARWLASAPKKPNGPATLAHINRLTAIASAEPNIGNEVLRLQERLAQSFTGQPLAAEEPQR